MLKRIIFLGVLLIKMLTLGGCKGKYEYQEGDFALTVEVENKTLQADAYNLLGDGRYFAESPVVMAMLTNKSGKRIVIAGKEYTKTAVLFNIRFPTGEGIIAVSMPKPPRKGCPWTVISLDEGEFISKRPTFWEYGFAVGEHEATVSASFYVNHKSKNRQLIRLENTFKFIVINGD